MKNFEWSDSTSNLLVVSSVLLAFTPFLLGDQLVLIVSGLLRETAVMMDQVSTNIASLFL
jgi:hypothetical protein